MSGTMLRIRRRRRLAAALRWCARREATGNQDLAPLQAQLTALAIDQGHVIPPGTDPPETLARIDHGGVMPPEVVAMLAALLTSLHTSPARSSDP